MKKEANHYPALLRAKWVRALIKVTGGADGRPAVWWGCRGGGVGSSFSIQNSCHAYISLWLTAGVTWHHRQPLKVWKGFLVSSAKCKEVPAFEVLIIQASVWKWRVCQIFISGWRFLCKWIIYIGSSSVDWVWEGYCTSGWTLISSSRSDLIFKLCNIPRFVKLLDIPYGILNIYIFSTKVSTVVLHTVCVWM